MILNLPPGGVHVLTAPLCGFSRASLLVDISPTQTLPAASTDGSINPGLGAGNMYCCTCAATTCAPSGAGAAVGDVAARRDVSADPPAASTATVAAITASMPSRNRPSRGRSPSRAGALMRVEGLGAGGEPARSLAAGEVGVRIVFILMSSWQ